MKAVVVVVCEFDAKGIRCFVCCSALFFSIFVVFFFFLAFFAFRCARILLCFSLSFFLGAPVAAEGSTSRNCCVRFSFFCLLGTGAAATVNAAW